MLQMKFLVIKFQENVVSYQSLSLRTEYSAQSGNITKTSFRLANKNIIMSETVNDRQNLSDEHYYEVGIVLPSSSVCENY